jgi:hypothetical protein
VSTSIDTTSGPVPVTAACAACRSSARRPAGSEHTNGATCAMPSRHDASSAGLDRPTSTVTVRSRTWVNPAAVVSRRSAAGSLPHGSVSRLNVTYHGGGR